MRVLTIFFLFLIMTASAAEAQLRPASCRVIGIRETNEYVTRKDRQCFRNISRAERRGFARMHPENRARVNRNRRCPVVAIKPLEQYLVTRERRCFPNERRAERRGFIPLEIAPDLLPPDPTPTPPLPPGGPLPAIQYSNLALEPVVPGSGLSGVCDVTLHQGHTQITMNCIHNVASASEAHLHTHSDALVCALVQPPGNFQLICPLTLEQSQAILAGQADINIHQFDGQGVGPEVVRGFFPPQ